MSKDELIGKLQMVYVGDRNALNELIGYYDGLKELIKIVKQENRQLKEDYNKAIHEATEFESKVYELQDIITELKKQNS